MPSAFHPESFFDVPAAAPGTERFDVLLRSRGVILERIVSSGSQPAQRYCQDQDEWVMLVRGTAEMRIDGLPVQLQAGQFLMLPKHTPHEVISTSQNAVWLALHVQAPEQSVA
jgi:cupin 2 domain-containing protein